MNSLIDATETLLAHLVCADGDGLAFSVKGIGRGGLYEEVDAGVKLCIDPMFPKSSHTAQHLSENNVGDEDDERLYTTDPNLLLHPIQDLIGSRAEIALICGDRIKWTGYRKINKPPKSLGVIISGGLVGAQRDRHSICCELANASQVGADLCGLGHARKDPGIQRRMADEYRRCRASPGRQNGGGPVPQAIRVHRAHARSGQRPQGACDTP